MKILIYGNLWLSIVSSENNLYKTYWGEIEYMFTVWGLPKTGNNMKIFLGLMFNETTTIMDIGNPNELFHNYFKELEYKPEIQNFPYI